MESWATRVTSWGWVGGGLCGRKVTCTRCTVSRCCRNSKQASCSSSCARACCSWGVVGERRTGWVGRRTSPRQGQVPPEQEGGGAEPPRGKGREGDSLSPAQPQEGVGRGTQRALSAAGCHHTAGKSGRGCGRIPRVCSSREASLVSSSGSPGIREGMGGGGERGARGDGSRNPHGSPSPPLRPPPGSP